MRPAHVERPSRKASPTAEQAGCRELQDSAMRPTRLRSHAPDTTLVRADPHPVVGASSVLVSRPPSPAPAAAPSASVESLWEPPARAPLCIRFEVSQRGAPSTRSPP